MQGGKKGLIVSSRNLCAATARAQADFTAHNGKVRNLTPAVKVSCGKKKPNKK
jgi:hypothetical protein